MSRGRQIEDAILTHRSSSGGYFTLMLQPPERVMPKDVMPKELVFVLDTSGSMSGFPIEKAKETMKLALRRPLSAGHFQPHHLRWRHAYPLFATSTRHARQP